MVLPKSAAATKELVQQGVVKRLLKILKVSNIHFNHETWHPNLMAQELS